MPNPKALVLEPLRRTASDAYNFALVVHAEQTDKAGAPYIGHLGRVVDRADDLRSDAAEAGAALSRIEADGMRQIAWLHDVIEDTDYTADDLRAEGFSLAVILAVHSLSNMAGLPYSTFIRDIVATGYLPTILVKIADVEDNSDPARLALLPAETRSRLEKKYGAALPVLKAAAERLGWKERS